MADFQLEYCRRTEDLLAQNLSAWLRGGGSGAGENQSEAMTLRAEYAIDFAAQAMRYALLAALTAAEEQRGREETKEEPV